MTEIRILTVRQPYAWAILHGGKDVENRTRNIAGDYRGPVLIHVGRQHHEGGWGRILGGFPPFDTDSLADYVDWKESMIRLVGDYRGHILGVVDLVDVHRTSACFTWALGGVRQLSRDEWADYDRISIKEFAGDMGKGMYCSQWAKDFDGSFWHLALANPRPLPTPIPWTGRLGLTRFETTCSVCNGKRTVAHWHATGMPEPPRTSCTYCNGTGEQIPGLEALL